MKIHFLCFSLCFLMIACQFKEKVDALGKLLNERDLPGGEILNILDEKDEDKKDNVEILEDNAVGANDDQDNRSDYLEPFEADGKDLNAIDSDRVLGAQEITSLIKRGKYQQVANGKIDEKNMTSRYYRGIAYYVMAQIYPTPIKRKMSYVRKAEADLKHVGIYSKNKNLKPRAILWHGITMYQHRFSEKNLPEIEKAFIYIQEKFSDSRCLNDSLLYSALIYAKAKDIESAELFLLELNETDAEDKIYDADYKKWITPQEAANHYLKLFDLGYIKEKQKGLSDNKVEVVLDKKLEKKDTELVLNDKKKKVKTSTSINTRDMGLSISTDSDVGIDLDDEELFNF